MDPSMTQVDKRAVYRSLCLLVKGLENRLVTVDLRNETSVSGRIVQVDGKMNIVVNEAAFVEYEGTYKYFETLFIPARMIRDVVIPSDMPIIQTITSLIPKKPVKAVEKKPMTFKKKRAMKQQEETLALIRNTNNPMPSSSAS